MARFISASPIKLLLNTGRGIAVEPTLVRQQCCHPRGWHHSGFLLHPRVWDLFGIRRLGRWYRGLDHFGRSIRKLCFGSKWPDSDAFFFTLNGVQFGSGLPGGAPVFTVDNTYYTIRLARLECYTIPGLCFGATNFRQAELDLPPSSHGWSCTLVQTVGCCMPSGPRAAWQTPLGR